MHCVRRPCSSDERVAQKDTLQDIAGIKVSIDDSDEGQNQLVGKTNLNTQPHRIGDTPVIGVPFFLYTM